MAQARPELIFLSGPQQGERAVLMTEAAVLGRSSSCEVCIKEPFASRQHVRFELTTDGWVVEDISSTGTRINGKRYRAGKKVILDTGDVLGIGADTEILFVAPGADPEKALAEYRITHPDGSPAGAPGEMAGEGEAAAAGGAGTVPLPPASPPEGAAATAAAGAGARKMALGLDGPKTEDLGLNDTEREAVRNRTAKVKKYAVIFGIYGLVLIGAVILFSSLGGNDVVGPSGEPKWLEHGQIREALEAPIERSRNPVLAQKELKAAQDLSQRMDADPGNPYLTVKNLKLYLAHKEGPRAYEDPAQAALYQEAMKKLMEAVTSNYDNAHAHEGNEDWAGAIRLYDQLARIVPERQPGDPAYDKLFDNIKAHLAYCHKRSGRPR